MSKHPIDILSLGAGLLFTLLALGYLLVPGSMSLMVVIPLMLIALGVLGIVGAVVAQRRRQEALEHL
jgi:VIT1/CCC1 family predicted Fe2+/Mn2+ transporter